MRIRYLVFLLASFAFIPGKSLAQTAPALPAPVGIPDAIYYNGKVVTVDSRFGIQQAFAVKGDQFLTVGTDAAVRKLAGPQTRQVDLKGHTVIPGLIDSHDHVFASAMASRGVDVSGVTSVDDMLSRIRAAVAKAKPGEVVFTSEGYRLNKLPTRQELDQISTEIPIVVSPASMNSAAMKAPDAVIPIPSGASPGRSEYGRAAKVIPPPTKDEEEELVLKWQRAKNAEGLTSVRDLSLYPDAMRAYYRLWRQNKLLLRTSVALFIEYSGDVGPVLSGWGIGAGFGDHWLRLDSVAEQPRPNAGNRLQGTDYNGGQQDEYAEAMTSIDLYDWRPSLAEGGTCFPSCKGVLELTLRAYEEANRVAPINGKRWVFEQGPQVSPEQLDRMAKLGVVLSAPARPASVDPKRNASDAESAAPVKDYLDHHIVVANGTDTHGYDRDDNPFLAFHWYVTRATADGTVHGADQKISRQDALKLSTINPAYLTFEENVKGSIELGKLADFVILNQDIMTIPDDQILSTHPLATYLGGKEVYRNGDGF